MNMLKSYYNQRAPEYDRIYERDDAVRNTELKKLGQTIQSLFRDRCVLEVACGTGYWTQKLFPVAKYVMAVDVAPAMLQRASARQLPKDRVCFRPGDAYNLADIPGIFDGALANFWFSHVPRLKTRGFLDHLHNRLEPGAVVFLADNVYIDGLGGELTNRRDTDDTYKLRRLADGSCFDVLKNYYTESDLRELFHVYAQELHIHMGACYWWLSYRI